MILSSSEILRCLYEGLLTIEPFDKAQLGPNSYNLRLAQRLMVYDEIALDAKRENRTKTFLIPENGFTLLPNVLYLGSTVERTYTPRHVPLLEGRSSFARLGLTVHVSAGFGDIGFNGHWTLEMSVVHPLIIYPNMQVCQIFYNTIQGQVLKTYNGKYQNAIGVQASRLHLEYEGQDK